MPSCLYKVVPGRCIINLPVHVVIIHSGISSALLWDGLPSQVIIIYIIIKDSPFHTFAVLFCYYLPFASLQHTETLGYFALRCKNRLLSVTSVILIIVTCLCYQCTCTNYLSARYQKSFMKTFTWEIQVKSTWIHNWPRKPLKHTLIKITQTRF